MSKETGDLLEGTEEVKLVIIVCEQLILFFCFTGINCCQSAGAQLARNRHCSARYRRYVLVDCCRRPLTHTM